MHMAMREIMLLVPFFPLAAALLLTVNGAYIGE
jgi:hypothetical protein